MQVFRPGKVSLIGISTYGLGMCSPLLESMYTDKSGNGGHPNVDVILMFKIPSGSLV